MTLLFLSLGVLVWLGILSVEASARKTKHAFEICNENAGYLISAIERYSLDCNEYPNNLQELVPYYIKIIPKTTDSSNYIYTTMFPFCSGYFLKYQVNTIKATYCSGEGKWIYDS